MKSTKLKKSEKNIYNNPIKNELKIELLGNVIKKARQEKN
jgi:hypothetical protein